MDPRYGAATVAVVVGLIVTIVLAAYIRTRSPRVVVIVASLAFPPAAIACLAVSLGLQALAPRLQPPFGAAYLMAGLLFAVASVVAWLLRWFLSRKREQ